MSFEPLYEVYQSVANGDDKLIAQNLTKREAEKLKSEHPDYIVVPQFINGG